MSRLGECRTHDKMNGQGNSYRYYYYGPLSIRRDGRAMGCREAIN